MSYQVLARKWRPKTFADMVGQEHVLQALINALNKQRLHHAYLFSGTRGVGKTTVARILAKALNCDQGVSSTPCGTCRSCIALDQGRFIDLIEVDAASRTKVEDTRELLDNVQYAPSQGRYKVYLIDEVHMLSGHSFNALLKTLEEPPAHVKFLLATTDPQKLPITVLSRCLQFHLKNMLPEQIQKYLGHILTQENITYEQNALWQLARAAEGSMRDGLSLLDQAIAYSNDNVSEAAISQMLGTVENTHIIAIARAIAEKNSESLFSLCNELATQGCDFASALEDILSLLHQIALCQAVVNVMPDNNQEQQMLRELAAAFSREDVQLCYQIGLMSRRDLPLAPSPRVGFEMCLLRMLAFQPDAAKTIPPLTPPTNKSAKPAVNPPQNVFAEKIGPAAKSTDTNNVSAHNSRESHPRESRSPERSEEAPGYNEILCGNDKTLLADNSAKILNNDWATILPQLKLNGIAQILASHCMLIAKQGTHIELVLDASQTPMLNDKLQARIAEALSNFYGETISVNIKAGENNLASPAGLIKQQKNEKRDLAELAIHNDQHVQQILKQFDATIAPGSIKPQNI